MNDHSTQTERQKKVVKQAKKTFLILLGIGLFLGILVSIGVVKLMNSLGLTEKTNQIEILQQKDP